LQQAADDFNFPHAERTGKSQSLYKAGF